VWLGQISLMAIIIIKSTSLFLNRGNGVAQSVGTFGDEWV
jgi:hypothetical protein